MQCKIAFIFLTLVLILNFAATVDLKITIGNVFCF